MESVSYKTALDLFSDLIGSVVGQVTTVDSDTFNRLFNRTVRRGWDFSFWPVLMARETRAYRDAWTATGYALGAEVYYVATAGAYWRANAITLAGDVPGVSAKWTLISPLDAYVAYEQTGKTPLGTVKWVRNADPRAVRPTYPLEFELDERGVTLTANSIPATCCIYFRRRCPAWRGAAYDAALIYAAGLTRYYASTSNGFDGDFWTTTATTVAGENPETTPAKWSKIEVPAFLCDFAVAGAKIGYLEGDGQLEKALANAQSALWEHLYDELDKIEGQTGQARVARVANF